MNNQSISSHVFCSHLKNRRVALKHSFQHPEIYALNQYFHSEISSRQRRLQHFWTGIRTITQILTFKSLFTHSPFWASVAHWWTAAVLCRRRPCNWVRPVFLSALASVCRYVMWKGQPGFSTSQSGEKITPTERFLCMSKMQTAISMRHGADRDWNDLPVKGIKTSPHTNYHFKLNIFQE